MKQFKTNYAYLIYMIEYSQHDTVQCQSIELGVGFPEHHNKGTKPSPTCQSFIDKEMLSILGLVHCFNEDEPTRRAKSIHIAINMVMISFLFSLGM